MAFDFRNVHLGQILPDLEVPLTRTLIVATAIASRDYQDVHHDPDLAIERGSKDIFMNILTSNGMAERYVRDWAGSDVFIKRIKLRLGVPNYPGDTMVCRGEVIALRAAESEADIDIKFMNSLGMHASGMVTLKI